MSVITSIFKGGGDWAMPIPSLTKITDATSEIAIFGKFSAKCQSHCKIFRSYGTFMCNYVCSNGRVRFPTWCRLGDTFMAPPQLNPKYATVRN